MVIHTIHTASKKHDDFILKLIYKMYNITQNIMKHRMRKKEHKRINQNKIVTGPKITKFDLNFFLFLTNMDM